VKLGCPSLISRHSTLYKYFIVIVQECTTFELVIGIVGTHESPCVQI